MRVPVVEQRVGVAPVPSARFQPAQAAGAGEQMLGQAMSQVGRMVFERAKELKIRDDKTGAMQLYNDYAKRRQQYMYGKGGIMTLMGPGTKDAYDHSVTALETMRDESLGLAENDDQRFILNGLLGEDINQSTAMVSRHEAEENQKAVKSAFEGTLAQARSDVALAAGDPTMFDAAVKNVQGAMILLYNLDTENPEHVTFLNQQMELARQELHTYELDSMIKAKNYTGAQAWFDKYKEDLPADKIASFKQSIDAGLQDDRVRELAGELVGKYDYHKSKDCYDYIRANDDYDADTKKMLISEMRTRFGEQESQFLQSQSDTYDSAVNQIAAAPSYTAALGIIKDSGLKQELQDRLRADAADKFNIDPHYANTAQYSDMKILSSIIVKAGQIDPRTGKSAFLIECPNWNKFFDKYGGKLSNADQRYFLNIYKPNGKDASEEEIAWGFNRASMLSRLIKDAGIDDLVEESIAWQYVQVVAATIEKETGKKMTPAEYTKVAKDNLETYRVWVRGRSLLGIDVLWPDVRKNITPWKENLLPGFIYDEKRQAILYKGPDGKLYKVDPSYFE